MEEFPYTSLVYGNSVVENTRVDMLKVQFHSLESPVQGLEQQGKKQPATMHEPTKDFF